MNRDSQIFRKMKTAAVATFVVAIALSAVPGLASASKLSVAGGTLKYSGQGREENNVSVSLLAGTYTVTDNGSNVLLRVGRGCVMVSGDTATCTDTGIDALSVVTGAREDTISVDASVSVPSKLTGGSDENVITGGSGDDRITGGSSEDVLTGALGADSIIAAGGEDTINSADGVQDKLNCGGGEDILTTDPIDILAPNCP